MIPQRAQTHTTPHQVIFMTPTQLQWQLELDVDTPKPLPDRTFDFETSSTLDGGFGSGQFKGRVGSQELHTLDGGFGSGQFKTAERKISDCTPLMAASAQDNSRMHLSLWGS
jgi:hypothetical protein